MTNTTGTVSNFTKIAYGFGLGAEGIKNNTFNVFLLIFYQQVVGLDIRLCGAALFITLMVDAIGDPLIGSWSDGLKSKWGRRLPFMFASSIPLGSFFWCVLNPPHGMTQIAVFAWLVCFASATRFSMSLFSLPHQSLVAELSDDFGERVSLQNLRNVFGWLFGLLNVWLGFNVFLATTSNYPVGVLNPEGYRHFAVWGSIVLVASTLISTLGVRSAVLRIPPTGQTMKSISIPEFPRAMWRAIASSQSYRAALGGGLLMWMAFGMTENTRTYMSSYFWGLSSERTAAIIYMIVGSVLVVLATARPLARRLGKRRLGMYSMLLFGLCEPTAITLRLIGVLPGNNDAALMPILLLFWFVGFFGIIMAMTIWGTMIADVADEYELKTGARQEGLLYSAGTFLQKSATGGGGVFASAILFFSRFPEHAKIGVSHSTISMFGVLSALTTAGLALLGAFCFSRFTLEGAKHVAVLTQLKAKRGAYVVEPETEVAAIAGLAALRIDS